ncbi:major capsid protein [Methylobacter sp. Wu1]|uniref:major capsid protein n=1 Tax=Methylobacter sp. Wu1 TaxID=3119359 RepID=UPI002F94CA2A
MSCAEFGPTGPAYEQIIRPNTLPVMATMPVKKTGSFKQNKMVFTMKNLMTKIRSNKFARKAAALGATAVAGIDSASAAVPAEITAALDEAKTDGAAIAAGFLLVVIIIAVAKLSRRAA